MSLWPTALTTQRLVSLMWNGRSGNTASISTCGQSGGPGRAFPRRADVATRCPSGVNAACSVSSYSVTSRWPCAAAGAGLPASAPSRARASHTRERSPSTFITRRSFSARLRGHCDRCAPSLPLRTRRGVVTHPGPGEAAEPGEKRVARLEHLEAGGLDRGVELRRAVVAVVAVPERLEDDGRHEPPERAEGGQAPLARPQGPERPADERGPPVGQEDGVPAGPQRAVAALQEPRGLRVPVQRVHAHEHVDRPSARERDLRHVEVLDRELRQPLRVVLLPRDRDEVPDPVDADDRVPLPREPEADVPDAAGDVQDPDPGPAPLRSEN